MKIAKIAGQANVGPKVWNTRKYQNKAVMTMNKVPGAKSLYNAIDNGTITNFRNVEAIIQRMHRAGIHHGNLHGDNILVYKNSNGKIRLAAINFGASKYHRGIKNARSAVRYALEKRGWRGGSVNVTNKYMGYTGPALYQRPGRNQVIRSNEEMLRNLKTYFNTKRLG